MLGMKRGKNCFEALFNCMVSKLERDGGPLCCQNSTEVVSLRDQPTTEVFCAPSSLTTVVVLYPFFCTTGKMVRKGLRDGFSCLSHK